MQTTIVGEIHTPGLLMSGQSSVRLSVIIPAYNEEERLPETLRQALDYLASEPYSAEIIVVNDGSTDATEKLVRGWPRGPIPVRLLNHPMRSNRGKDAGIFAFLWMLTIPQLWTRFPGSGIRSDKVMMWSSVPAR
jgi:hypothetical protein